MVEKGFEIGKAESFGCLFGICSKLGKKPKDSLVRRISNIRHIGHIENKVVLQGVEEGVENVDDGLAWSIVISKKTGKVVLSASGNGVAYVVFGTCNEVLKYRPKPHSVSPKLIGPFEFVITGEAMKNENLKSAFLLGIFIFMGMACLGFFLGTNMTTLKAC